MVWSGMEWMGGAWSGWGVSLPARRQGKDPTAKSCSSAQDPESADKVHSTKLTAPTG